MKCTIHVSVGCRDEETARSLLAVLSPDNRAFPKDQRFSSEMHGREIVFRVDSGRFFSAVSTVESILADAKLFQEVWLLRSS